MAVKLTAMGFRVYLYRYHSLTRPLVVHSQALERFVRALNIHTPINFVAHSLGGLVVRQWLHDYPQFERVGRIVTLGTPHQGSVTADYVHRYFPYAVGQAYADGLDGNLSKLPNDFANSQDKLASLPQLGTIIGNKPVGLGQWFLNHHNKTTGSHHEHDGTVLVSESFLPWATDSLILPVSHTGMLMDKTVAKQSAYFIRHGQFLHD